MTTAELLDALRAGAASCHTCQKLVTEVSWKDGDLKTLARKAAYDHRDRDWTENLAAARAQLAAVRKQATAHLDEPHADPAPKLERTFKPKDAGHRRKPRCADCGATHPGNPDRCPRRAAADFARAEMGRGAL